MAQIKFGTDGWRAVIGDQYTYDNLARVAQATGQWLKATYDDPSVVIGYDTRFEGEAFARHTARTLASQGVRVRLADSFVTTPAVSWAAKHYNHSAGIVITASHNPPKYNGFKIKAHFGGPATPAMIKAVEAELDRLGDDFAMQEYAALEREGLIKMHNLAQDYVNVLKDGIDIARIKASGQTVAYDAMYGAGQGIVTELLGADKTVELHHDHNPGMHGQAPEPIEKNLAYLARAVAEERCAAGLATDGDADRIGMFDEAGRFVSSHELLALLVKYLHEEKGLSGSIVKTFSTTDLLDKMGEKYGLPVETTKIGFKYIGPKIVEGDVLVGGEESGGMAIKGHIAERDGLFIGLTIVEMMVQRERLLSELVQELWDEFGEHHQARADLHTTEARKQEVLKQLESEGLSEVDGQKVEKSETLDGFKFRTPAGWLMFRPSGTEPVLRIYSEAETEKKAKSIVQWGVDMVQGK